MDKKDWWARIAFKLQPHLDAICDIAKDESLDMLSIGAKGIIEEKKTGKVLKYSVVFIDEDADEHYSCYSFSDNSTELLIDGDTFRKYTRT